MKRITALKDDLLLNKEERQQLEKSLSIAKATKNRSDVKSIQNKLTKLTLTSYMLKVEIKRLKRAYAQKTSNKI